MQVRASDSRAFAPHARLWWWRLQINTPDAEFSTKRTSETVVAAIIDAARRARAAASLPAAS
jgi:hypothetical protein